MLKKLTWLRYAADYVLRSKIKPYNKIKYCKCAVTDTQGASAVIKKALESGRPFFAGRLGLFELAVMRMYEFEKKSKYETVINNIYNCAGFFPRDISLGKSFTLTMTEALKEADLLACSSQLCENYFINKYMDKKASAVLSFSIFDVCKKESCWSEGLKGKRVLVVSPFSKTIETQYKKREQLFPGSHILPEFELLTYQSLMTIGDLKDDRFATWFDALEFMKAEILKMDFDVALLGCGAYGFPLASAIKTAGRQAIHMGGSLQILFGIMGKRWDGTRLGGERKIREDIAPYYNESWTYPLEERPSEADKVEYGPYWK